MLRLQLIDARSSCQNLRSRWEGADVFVTVVMEPCGREVYRSPAASSQWEENDDNGFAAAWPDQPVQLDINDFVETGTPEKASSMLRFELLAFRYTKTEFLGEAREALSAVVERHGDGDAARSYCLAPRQNEKDSEIMACASGLGTLTLKLTFVTRNAVQVPSPQAKAAEDQRHRDAQGKSDSDVPQNRTAESPYVHQCASHAQHSSQAMLFPFLQKHHLEFYFRVLTEKGYTEANFDKLCHSDLQKLRITNPKEQQRILDAVRVWAAEAQKESDESRAATAITTVSKPPAGPIATATDVVEFSDFTATVGTAQEAARQATIYLAHRRVDRPWPKAESALSQRLNLSYAAAKNAEDPMYSIVYHGDVSAVFPPPKQQHGYSSKFCPVCEDFVTNSVQGQWQYLHPERVLVGDGVYEDVSVWKMFHPTESLKIEYARKRRQPAVKVRGLHAVFQTMQWGEYPMRRIDTEPVPFPTLKKSDVVKAPSPHEEPIQALSEELHALHVEHALTEERKSRLAIAKEEAIDIGNVLAQIEAMVLAYHDRQRQDLAAEEERCRALISGPEYERGLDAIWEWVEDSVRSVDLLQATRAAEAVLRKQCAVQEDIEEIARRDIVLEEEAARANLVHLLSCFNQTIQEILAKKKEKHKRRQFRAARELRCAVCRRTDCPFFKHPWVGQWRARGGVLDLHFRLPNPTTLSSLVGRASDAEYQEHMETQKALREHLRAKSRILQKIQSVSAQRNADMSLPPRPQSAGGGVPSPIHFDSSYADTRDATLDVGPRSRPQSRSSVREASRSPSSRPFSVGGVRNSNVTPDSISRLTKCTRR